MLIETQSDHYPFDHFFGTGGADSDFQKSIYDFFPGIIYVYDAASKQLRYVNKKITEVLGYSLEDVQSWENDFTKIVFNEDLDLVKKELEKYDALQDVDTHGYKCRFTRKEGDYLHFHVTGKILKRNEAGKPLSILFIAQDISETIQSAQEAKAVKTLMNETEELLQFGTWTWDIQTNKLSWSDGMYPIYGYKNLLELNGTLTHEFVMQHVVEEDSQDLQKLIQKSIVDKKGFEKIFSIHDHAGVEKKVYSKGKVIVDDQGIPIKILGITRCITEQTRLYNDLLNYKEMILEKEEFLGHGSWEMNYADRSIQWSDGMYQLFGYDPAKKEEITVDEKLYYAHMSSYDVDESRKIIQGIVETDKSYLWEYEIKTATGELKKLETFAKIIRAKDGTPTKIIGTTRDVTQLRTYERDLERKISELKRSNKDLEDFAYVASHDIQEPLRKIISFSERLKNKYANELDDEAQRYLDRIMTATKSARQLIDGLMDFSRLAREEQLFEKTDLNALLQEVKTELELKIEETETVLRVSKLPALEVVPVQIKQLLSNLLLNSIKFRKQNIPATISLDCKKLTKADASKHGLDPALVYYEITIEDNGIGFEEEYSERIFQMFQRLHGKAEYPGAGIGLALCKKIAENHHGLIYAKSELNKGTIFSIILPETQG